MDTTRAVVMVAFYRYDVERGRAFPTIVGAIDAGTIEVIDQEQEDKLWREMREKFGLAEGDYEFRTVDLLIPTDELKKLIAVHEITASVASSRNEAP